MAKNESLSKIMKKRLIEVRREVAGLNFNTKTIKFFLGEKNEILLIY